MTELEIGMWLRLLPIVAAGLVLALLISLSIQHPPQLFLKACEEFSGLLREKNRNSGWYRRTAGWLNKNGAGFHYGKWLNPTWYLTIRIVLALLGMLTISGISLGYGILASIFLFFLPGWMLTYLNRQDNLKLLPEIKLVYHALEIQIRAGVYVTDALAECYGSVQEKRLRHALLELAGDIVMKADIYEALERFQGKFDNRYIDALCITILQALESGQAVELLSDISEQMKDMESTVMERRKGALDRSITFYQLGVLAAVLGVVLYACITHMYSAAIRF